VVRCRDQGEAEEVAGRLREALRGVAGAQVLLGAPRGQDLDCWEVLRFAGGRSGPVEA
jgi:hypothetical protein